MLLLTSCSVWHIQARACKTSVFVVWTNEWPLYRHSSFTSGIAKCVFVVPLPLGCLLNLQLLLRTVLSGVTLPPFEGWSALWKQPAVFLVPRLVENFSLLRTILDEKGCVPVRELHWGELRTLPMRASTVSQGNWLGWAWIRPDMRFKGVECAAPL